MHWNDEQVNLAIQWGERAAGYMWLHNEASNDYSRKKQYIGIPTIIISSLASVGSVATINSNPPLTLQILNGVTTFATVLLATLNNFLQFAEIAESHRNMSKEFSTYSRAISTQLSFPSSDRDNPKEFLNKYQHIFDDLIAKAPHIPDKIIKRFNLTFNDNSIAKPLIVNSLTPIVAYESHSNGESPDGSNQDETISVFKRSVQQIICRRRSVNLGIREAMDDVYHERPLGKTYPAIKRRPSIGTLDVPLDVVVLDSYSSTS